MRKLCLTLLILAVASLLGPAAFAQAAAEKAPERISTWVVIVSAFSMAFAAALCGLAQSRVASAACEGIARNPGAGDAIRLSMILGLVFIETLALFTLLVVFVKG